MRSVSRAICTSGDPVSMGSRRYESMISVLRSFVIDIVVLATSAADDLLPYENNSVTHAFLRRAGGVGEITKRNFIKKHPYPPLGACRRSTLVGWVHAMEGRVLPATSRSDKGNGLRV